MGLITCLGGLDRFEFATTSWAVGRLNYLSDGVALVCN